MSTEIRSLFTKSTAVLTIRSSAMHHTGVLICADEADASAAVCVPRADFLAAVETECGVRIVPADDIVIERAELPEVIVDGAERHLVHAGWVERHRTTDPAQERSDALMHLALAEYLAALPPVPPVSDEDVETLAGLLAEHHTSAGLRDIARRLLATGRVSVSA